MRQQTLTAATQGPGENPRPKQQPIWRALAVLALCLCLTAAGAVLGIGHAYAQALPRPDHIVIVIEENRGYGQIIGNNQAPYINELAQRGVLFTQSFGVIHPSQPNYLALFSGSTHGNPSDDCPLELSGANLASALIAKGLSFASYAESLPAAGALGCKYGAYHRKHNPPANWRGLEATLLPFGDFPTDFAGLPTVALVIPNQRNDMHNGSIADGDAWLKANIEPYAQWAQAHNSLLILTWDEDDFTGDNHIATIFVGSMVMPGSSAQRINHYNVLRTIEQIYGLPYANESAGVQPITGIWRAGRPAKK